MRIAVFGGSFDPVHNEHVNLVKSAIADLRLDKLFVMPAGKPPHKPGKELTADLHRLQMCKLAFQNIDKAEISDYELKKSGISYTFETCRYFREQYPTAEIFWLVGTDMLRDFPTWKNTASILNDVTLAVCARAERTGWEEKEIDAFIKRFSKKFAVVTYNGKEVSSTRIRVLLGAGESVAHLVPAPVIEYIERHNLYQIKNAKQALSALKKDRKEHCLRVAEIALKKAVEMQVSERKVLTASLFHDCAKHLSIESVELSGFRLNEEDGKVPESVLHQFTGAYLAEKKFGITDTEILDAIRYHTSGKENMTELSKIIFLADMVEAGRNFEGVEKLRALFYEGKGNSALDGCLTEALSQTIAHLMKKQAEIYPLTLKAYQYYKKEK